jgi:hypothetical protein
MLYHWLTGPGNPPFAMISKSAPERLTSEIAPFRKPTEF